MPLETVPPITTFSLIQELIHRDGLRSALSGRDDVLLEPVLRLLVKHVTDPRFGEMVCDISILLIGELPLSCVGAIMMEKMHCPRYVCPRSGSVPPHRYTIPSPAEESSCRDSLPERVDENKGYIRDAVFLCCTGVCAGFTPK